MEIKPHSSRIQDGILEVRISLAGLTLRKNTNQDNLQRLSRLIAQRSFGQIVRMEQAGGLAK